MTQKIDTEIETETDTPAKAGAVIIPVTLFEQNCTLIWCEATKKAAVIDPGGDVPKILEAIRQTKVTVEKIWLTHGHIDHVGGAAELRDALKVPIEGPHIADKFLLDNVVSSGARFGITGVRDFAPDRWLDEGEQVSVGELLSLIHISTPFGTRNSRHSSVFVPTMRSIFALAPAAMRSIGRAGITSPSITGCHGIMLTATSSPQRSGSRFAARSALSSA